ncbi:glycerophosphodiester phosphodiesterase family protein [Edaphobacter sp.]|uniref:glycerophosphodiester phosphodiesterase family protein n=1 Tax=Edaphobacter sp. TaxID=1934404 RepID=UPI002DB819AF|nr:glycerophosphodiester phosphodiesterase family protein [Edaphobacter sp.]HEU5342486.1 glycerophosphodiester phosphodiesterase family protein [Edaphobacter sp.]
MSTSPYLALMTVAHAHANAHGARTPALAPLDTTLLGANPSVNVAELRDAGFRVIPWTTNLPATMRKLIALRVDGIISDRPDILQAVLKEEAAAHPSEAAYFNAFESTGHRGARGLRPENTLPAFEAALDHLVAALETDIGITRDRAPLIWHEQFLDPRSCRRADHTRYTLHNRAYIRDITLAEAQSTFLCDKLHQLRFPNQTNNLALSPVAVAFAAEEHLIDPYAPTHVEQLFRFTHFYANYYRTGPGHSHPEAAARAASAEQVRFNIETKILPWPDDPEGIPVENLPIPGHGAEPTTNHTAAPQTFVTVLGEAISRNKMEARTRILSFDFRILQLVEEQLPRIPTFYLTESPASLGTALLPPSLRQP